VTLEITLSFTSRRPRCAPRSSPRPRRGCTAAAEKAGRWRVIPSLRRQSKVHSHPRKTAEFLGFSAPVIGQRDCRPSVSWRSERSCRRTLSGPISRSYEPHKLRWVLPGESCLLSRFPTDAALRRSVRGHERPLWGRSNSGINSPPRARGSRRFGGMAGRIAHDSGTCSAAAHYHGWSRRGPD
jgi:hypothetical protein